jgi:Flp pilus assembly protein TadG
MTCCFTIFKTTAISWDVLIRAERVMIGLKRVRSTKENNLRNQGWQADPVAGERPLKGLLARFAKDEGGAVIIIFAFLLLVMIGIVGGAVDYGRWLNAKSKQQSAIDAAVLAAGRAFQVSNGDISSALAAAGTYYAQLKPSFLSNDSTSFSVVDNGQAVAANAQAIVMTPFLSFAGIPELPVLTRAKAVMAAGGNAEGSIEISLMLDITGSMSGQRIEDLRLAAKDLVDIVVWDDQTLNYARVALAPFSEHINVGRNYFAAITGGAPGGSGTEKTCVRERDTADRYTDAAPGPDNFFDASSTWGACRPQTTIYPLSNDKQAIKSRIDQFGTEGMTAGHLGVAWAWYLLSPNWNTVWDAPVPVANYNTKTRKIAVLMTDGEFNRQYSGPTSSTQARTLCSGMKDKGIIVYSVGFQIETGGEAYQTMAQCATSSSHFFNSTTGEELRQAFREIALQVVTLRLSH